MNSQYKYDSVKHNSNIVITNKVIAFWSIVLQISNVCDIGKYVEIRKHKIGTGIIMVSIIAGFIIYKSYLSQDHNMIVLLTFFHLIYRHSI